MNLKIVLVGPHGIARRYAQRNKWMDDEYVIVTRGHQLAGLDPNLMKQIVTVKLHALNERIVQEIHEELDRIKILWPTLVTA